MNRTLIYQYEARSALVTKDVKRLRAALDKNRTSGVEVEDARSALQLAGAGDEQTNIIRQFGTAERDGGQAIELYYYTMMNTPRKDLDPRDIHRALQSMRDKRTEFVAKCRQFVEQ